MRAKKSLSQFFLTSRFYINKISDSVAAAPGSEILEIGAGAGALTEQFIKQGRFLTSVEIDSSLCQVLKGKFADYKNFKVVLADIRNFKVSQKDTLVVGNVPYHLSFEIIEYLVKNRDYISRAFVTFQKEFARKITADLDSKEYGFLTCFVQLYADIKYLFTIPKSSFSPRPKVDSSFVSFAFRKVAKFGLNSEGKFLGFLRAVFNFRRKKISNILGKLQLSDKREAILSAAGVDSSARPQNISLNQFVLIWEQIDLNCRKS